MCANGFEIASFKLFTLWEDISSYPPLEFLMQEKVLDTFRLLVGYIKML